MFQLLMLTISLAVYVYMNIQVRKEPKIKPNNTTQLEPIIKEWFKVDDCKPEHEMVFGLKNTYDCGWSVTYVYWNQSEGIWYDSHGIASMQPDYWAKLPIFEYPSKTTE